jgi:hypothetical protein
MLIFEVNAIGTAKTFVSVLLQDFLFLTPSAFWSFVTCPYTTTHHHLSRAKIALWFICSFEVNSIGTVITFVLLQLQDILFLSPSAFQSHVTCPYATTHHTLKLSTTAK